MRWIDVPHAPEVKAQWRSLFPDRIPPALLWKGIEGVGKTAAAWMLTKALLCSQGDPVEPCGTCRNCQLVDRLEHPNLLLLVPTGGKGSLEEGVQRFRQTLLNNPFLLLSEWELALSGAKGSLSLGVDTVRRLHEELSLVSPGKTWRVVWFWHAETLTRQAANALLKIIEEPPARTLFIFLTNQADTLPVTLRSRCQTWRFPPLSKTQLEQLAGAPLPTPMIILAQGSYGRLRRLRDASMEKSIRSLQTWLRTLLQPEADPSPAIEELLQAPQLGEVLVMGAILVREHPELTVAQKAIGMDILLRIAEGVEANLQPALLLWEATLSLKEKWKQPRFLWEWIPV
ncbi:MAG: hypothetical protein N3E49_01715 [Bacteroidia bacterium]|nr:hypothetical protein [Bacteroidia bacterium]